MGFYLDLGDAHKDFVVKGAIIGPYDHLERIIPGDGGGRVKRRNVMEGG